MKKAAEIRTYKVRNQCWRDWMVPYSFPEHCARHQCEPQPPPFSYDIEVSVRKFPEAVRVRMEVDPPTPGDEDNALRVCRVVFSDGARVFFCVTGLTVARIVVRNRTLWVHVKGASD